MERQQQRQQAFLPVAFALLLVLQGLSWPLFGRLVLLDQRPDNDTAADKKPGNWFYDRVYRIGGKVSSDGPMSHERTGKHREAMPHNYTND
jgi:hypothetical protein